jgi:hypothetical protein
VSGGNEKPSASLSTSSFAGASIMKNWKEQYNKEIADLNRDWGITSTEEKIIELFGKMDILDDWNKKFISDMMERVKRGGYLMSYSQENCVYRSWLKYNDESLQKQAAWEASGGYTEERKALAKIASEYYSKYAQTNYFVRITNKVDEGLPLQCWEYSKIVENKYAQRIIEGVLGEPKFSVGQTVSLRANIKSQMQGDYLLRAPSKEGIIVSVKADPIRSTRAGNITYRWLPFGGSRPLLVEECNLKKAKKRKKN